MDPAKVARVSKWLALTNRKEVQSFLGFVNFYRRFIEGFSHIARPLFDLTKSNSIFKWTDKEKMAFDTLRNRITSTPILTFQMTPSPIVLKRIAWTLPPEPSYLSKIQKMINGTLSPFCPNPCPLLKETMRYMTGDASHHLSPRRMEAFFRRGQAPIQDLDGSQEPGVFHVGQEIKPEASQMVIIAGQI